MIVNNVLQEFLPYQELESKDQTNIINMILSANKNLNSKRDLMEKPVLQLVLSQLAVKLVKEENVPKIQ